MEYVSLNQYLSADNIWTLRLLGLEGFKKHRDVIQVENEYNLDKYAKLLKLNFNNIEEYKVKEFENVGLQQDDKIYISLKEEIFRIKLCIARNIFYQIIKTKIEKYSSEHICELGCGYGFNLSLLNGKVYGGEYSDNAVTLARRLGLEVEQFNYYSIDDYSIIKPNSTVFTVHSIEQLPDATRFTEGMQMHKNKINYIINIEPSIIPERKSLIGLMRNKYIEMNDYNKNLFSILRSRNDIEIIEFEQDVIGINPLNSANMIVWRFKDN